VNESKRREKSIGDYRTNIEGTDDAPRVRLGQKAWTSEVRGDSVELVRLSGPSGVRLGHFALMTPYVDRDARRGVGAVEVVSLDRVFAEAATSVRVAPRRRTLVDAGCWAAAQFGAIDDAGAIFTNHSRGSIVEEADLLVVGAMSRTREGLQSEGKEVVTRETGKVTKRRKRSSSKEIYER